MPLMNSRLICAAELLGKQGVVADIGTDHAFLPIYMVQHGIATRVIACDVAPKPLKVAAANIQKHGLQGVITLRLADGLSAVLPEECDAVTITGMGGETIADILAAAGWLRQGKHSVVLQPMTCDDRLRRYLNENGYTLLAERAVWSQGRVYTVMKAVYTGAMPDAALTFPYIGRLNPQAGEAERAFVQKRLKSVAKCAASLQSVPAKQAEAAHFSAVAQALQALLSSANG